jgi:trypsin
MSSLTRRRIRTALVGALAATALATGLGAASVTSAAAGTVGAAGTGAAAAGGAIGGPVPRVIGGVAAPAGSWKSIAVLLFANTPDPTKARFCAGSLISAHWVLTAGHCVELAAGGVRAPSTVQVAVGIQTLSTITAANRVAVSQVIQHPGFSFPAGADTGVDDIALLRLAVNLPKPYLPIVSPAEDGLWGAGSKAMVAGWGTTQTGVQVFPDALQQVQVPVVDDARCGQIYLPFDAASTLCAGRLGVGGKDACAGDSGGPLGLAINGRRRLIGVVSGGRGCALPNFPGTYADVRGLYDWIVATAV